MIDSFFLKLSICSLIISKDWQVATKLLVNCLFRALAWPCIRREATQIDMAFVLKKKQVSI